MNKLLLEINEQPEVLKRLLDLEYGHVQSIAREILGRRIRHVLIAARGSSDNAALYAKYVLGIRNRLPVALAAPSMFTVYGAPPRLQDTMVLAISQSGMSPDIAAVVAEARKQGMLTMAITNSPDSSLCRVAERLVFCRAGEEKSVAATKTYTAELLAVAMLSVALRDDEDGLEELLSLPEAVRNTLGLDAQIESAVERYRYMSDCAVIARGFNYATAFELALKLKELTYVSANPYSSADFMHGPIAVVASGYPVFLVAPSGQVLTEMIALAKELLARQAELVIISDRDDILGFAETPLRLPVTLPEWLSPIVAILPGQLFAYRLALAKRLDPENPRGLQKITQTR
ncbi:MAG: SIS domain-containing protein [Chloroflexi bacterium]|nr:SIS domain-containing protein [Chloroflexota bacterium]